MTSPLFLEDIRVLSADRELATGELYEPNDYYGHAALLKHYAGYEPEYRIKASIEHGPTLTTYVWDKDVTAPLPAVLFPASYRQSVLQRLTSKALFAVGSFISYAEPHVSSDVLRREKSRLGKTLVVFPYHSTHWLTAHFDVASFCATVQDMARDFDSVLVCLYWKDIQLGRDEAFRERGFECVTAGHMYDPLFLPRLRSILHLADVTASNQMGTHVGYSAALGVPHWFISTGLSLDNPHNVTFDPGVNHDLPPHVQEMTKIFAERVAQVTPQQQTIIDTYWGTGELLSPAAMRDVFEITEELYNRGTRYFSGPDKVLPYYAADLINEQRYDDARRALHFTNKMYPNSAGVYYAKAYLAAVTGAREEAVDMLENNIIPIEEHPKMQQLLAELRGNVVQPETPASVVAEEGLAQAQVALAEANTLLQQGQTDTAFVVLNRAKALKQPVRHLDYLRAIAFIRMDRPVDARMAVLEELLYYSDNAEAKVLLNELERQQPLNTSSVNDEFGQILQVVRPYTMLSEERLYALYTQAKELCETNIPGNFVECGVARGGSSALLAYMIKRYSRQPRRVYCFDSFEGMPEPTGVDKHDGIAAEATGWGTGTCAAPETSVMEVAAKLGAADVVHTVKGYFDSTVPQWRDRVGMIALLHVDADWYESTKVVLGNLYDRVSTNGKIQIDDYGFWEGCRKAVDEFQAERGVTFPLTRIDGTGVCFVKPDSFPMNPAVPRGLVEEFRADDPVRQGVLSQMSENERFQLYYAIRVLLTKKFPDVRFIEIGCYAGASLAQIMLAFKRTVSRVQGFAVEPIGQPQFYKILELLKPEVTHLQLWSSEAAPVLKQRFEQDGNAAQFIFVDGDHTYEGVKKDIRDYYPLLAPGGIMMFHDFLPPLDESNREAIYTHHANTEPGIRKACVEVMEGEFGAQVLDIPLLYPDDPTQTQAYLPIIPGVFSTIRAYRKPE